MFNLKEIHPLRGTRDYLEKHWYTPGDISLMNNPGWENRDAFAGVKYDWYGGVGYRIKPRSILEVGTAAGYSIAAMIWGTLQGIKDNPLYQLEEVTLVDMHPDIQEKTLPKLRQFFPDIKFTCYLLDTQKEWERVKPKSYDIVHIDGDHTREGAWNDLLHFAPWCAPFGVVVVDDTRDPNVMNACIDYYMAHSRDYREIDHYNGGVLIGRKLA